MTPLTAAQRIDRARARMVRVAERPVVCQHCGGRLAFDAVAMLGTVVERCEACGRAAPLSPRNVLPPAIEVRPAAATPKPPRRRCADCGADIGPRAPTAKLCAGCVLLHRRANSRQAKRRWMARHGQRVAGAPCAICGTFVPYPAEKRRGRPRQRCEAHLGMRLPSTLGVAGRAPKARSAA